MPIGIVVNGKSIGYDGTCFDSERCALSDDVWADRAKGLLKAELKRRSLTYRDLAERLTSAGTPEEERNLRNKVARGSFTAAFLLQCLVVIGCHTIRLDDLQAAESS